MGGGSGGGVGWGGEYFMVLLAFLSLLLGKPALCVCCSKSDNFWLQICSRENYTLSFVQTVMLLLTG